MMWWLQMLIWLILWLPMNESRKDDGLDEINLTDIVIADELIEK